MNENMQQIPPPYSEVFDNGIQHPQLYLWDAWSFVHGEVLHLYCLAMSRWKPDGTVLQPIERNGFPFHIRHFISEDTGKTWKDKGCFLEVNDLPEKLDFYTIWSGSVAVMSDGKILVGYTGLSKTDSEHKFIQSIALAESADGYTIERILPKALSSPQRDRKVITQMGYYLSEPSELGNNDGESDGPILSWRDPFIFIDTDETINLFWGGKTGPKSNALVRVEIKKHEEQYIISKLHAPTTVPDGSEFTQLELPKVLHDKEQELYYLMVSSCNRLYEGQSDDEVDKGVRLYKSTSLEGPWVSLGDKILGAENLFGPTVLKTDFENNRLLCIAPYTDAVADHLSLTFSSVFYIYLDTLRVEFL